MRLEKKKQIAILLVLIMFTILYFTNRREKPEIVAKKAGWLQCEPEIVELCGKMISKVEYGPPGYGENPKTDSKGIIYKIILEKPIKVQGDPKSGVNVNDYENITELQLVHKIPLKEHLNKNVCLKGTLFEGISGHHYTKVLMNVIVVVGLKTNTNSSSPKSENEK